MKDEELVKAWELEDTYYREFVRADSVYHRAKQRWISARDAAEAMGPRPAKESQ